uniref:Uncharacterized protein n=1 Tax=Moniliophthora roreri TaxID=221103 RepID=A0A0W0FVA6_MONRR
MTVEVAEPKKGLNVFGFTESGPVSDSSDLIFGHPETVRREYVAKELTLRHVELTLLGITEQAVLLESPKDLLDMLLMVVHVFGVDKNVVKVDDNTDVQQVSENGVDKMLESGRSVTKPAALSAKAASSTLAAHPEAFLFMSQAFFFTQLLILCLSLQNMQRLLSWQHFHSSSVSFPFLSLPSSQEDRVLGWLPGLKEKEEEEGLLEGLSLPETELEFLAKSSLLSLALELELVPGFEPEDWAVLCMCPFSA